MYQYKNIVKYVLEKGEVKENRTGIDTISIFNYNYKLDLRKGFPLLTTKKIRWRNILFENLWFLSGSNRVDFLHKHNVKFWDPWIEKEQCKKIITCDHCKTANWVWDEEDVFPEAYGRFWRKYPSISGSYNDTFDQFGNLIDGLNNNPFSRRHILTNWHPEHAAEAKLPPCHIMGIFNVQMKNGEQVLNLHLTQRSCDIALGLPYNIAGYAFLLSLVSHLTGIKPGFFAHSIVDAHIYVNHIDNLKKQIEREERELPKLIINPYIKTLSDIDRIISEDKTEEIENSFTIENYNPHPAIKYEAAV